jgi:hypothetical protein
VLSYGALADASYQTTTQQTGGSAAQIMGMGSLFHSGANDMKKANTVILVVKGNRMARISEATTVIFDLDQQTLTKIDSKKKQYSIATFDQIEQENAAAAGQMKLAMDQHKNDPMPQLPPELAKNPPSFDAKATTTGATKDVSGISTHEVLLEEDMIFRAQNGSTDSVTYYVTNDQWLANSEPPGWKEIQDFNMRLYSKLKMMAFGDMVQALIAAHPQFGEGLKKLGEEQKKQEGVPIMIVQRLGGRGQGASAAPASGTSVVGTQGTGMATEVASNTATETAQKEASQLNSNGKMGIFSSSLVDAAVGAFSRHAPSLTQSAVASTSSKPSSASPQSFDQVMMETTTVFSNFSQETVPPSAFQIPAGYQKLDFHEAMQPH